MAATDTRALAAAHHADQARLSVLLAREYAAAWRLLDVKHLKRSLPRVIAAVARLVARYGSISALLAAEYYANARAAAGARGTFDPLQADTPDVDAVRAAIEWATRGLWSTEPDVAKALVLSQGATQKLVADTGRNTIDRNLTDDRQALGWIRVTDADPCYFCAMLASRGPVYKSRESAGGGAFKFHDHDQCTVAPIFDRGDPLVARSQALEREWADVTEKHYGKAKVTAWRQYWDEHHPSS